MQSSVMPAKYPASETPAEIATTGAAPVRRTRRYDWPSTIPFVLAHLAVLAAFWTGVTWQAVVVCIALYVIRMFAVTGGYHRYFSHRAFETSRVMQFVFAWVAQSSSQKSALWWASHHRAHHLFSDTERDLHSVRQDGFLHAHCGWIFDESDPQTDWKRIQDFAKYPELVWLDRWFHVPTIVLGALVYLAFGASGLVIGFFLSTVLTWHGTFFINSLAHVWGKRRFPSKDDSRNNFWLALITMGEGWHNNHHHYMRSARQGFYWWEVDLTYYGLLLMEKLGLVWNLQPVPERVLADGRARDTASR
jgi:stearoyl-CoA desaturase (Delta-9 desaturase)